MAPVEVVLLVENIFSFYLNTFWRIEFDDFVWWVEFSIDNDSSMKKLPLIRFYTIPYFYGGFITLQFTYIFVIKFDWHLYLDDNSM